MSDIDDRITEWLQAEVINAPVAERLRSYERSRTSPAHRPAASRATEAATEAAGEAAIGKPTVIEAVVYLGLIVIASGVIALIGLNWSELSDWARIGVCVVPLVALLILGFALNASDQPGMRRGGQFSWFVAVGLFMATVAVIMDVADIDFGDSASAFLVFAALSLLFAIALWVVKAGELQLLAVAACAGVMVHAIAAFPDSFSTELVGICGLAVMVMALAASEVGWLPPRPVARLAFGLLGLVTAYEAGWESPAGFEALTFVAAAGLLALGIARNSFLLVVLGIGGLFVALITFVFRHFSDSLGAPFALIISGGLVLLGVMLVVQARSITRMRTRMRQGPA